MKLNNLVIISGVSGAGKSTALRAFEDLGYFCIENLPAQLLESLMLYLEGIATETPKAGEELEDLLTPSADRYSDFALLINIRDRESLGLIMAAVKRLRSKTKADVSLLFFDCQDEVVIRRFRETRRPHPLLLEQSSVQTIADALAKERELLSGFRAEATRIIDTAAYSPHDLRRVIEEYVGKETELPDLTAIVRL